VFLYQSFFSEMSNLLFPHLGKRLPVISSLASCGLTIDLLENAWSKVCSRLLEEATRGKTEMVMDWHEMGLESKEKKGSCMFSERPVDILTVFMNAMTNKLYTVSVGIISECGHSCHTECNDSCKKSGLTFWWQNYVE
jgi:hypothetical protein